MKVSHKWLSSFFEDALPSPEAIADALTFHAWEVEEIIKTEGDTVLDIKVLPDKSSWALCHRGIAKDLSIILNHPLVQDPLRESAELAPQTGSISIDIQTDTCTRYTAAHITGVKVGPSPSWLKERLAVIGQRSINNVVDATNYVMFELGQPLHAFDAKKLAGLSIVVRNAREGEEITTLTGETYALSASDAVIADGMSGMPLGIAGIKGGKAAEVTGDTVDLLLESAHFKHIPVRHTSKRLKLRTDASMRFENNIVPELAPYGLMRAAKLIAEIAGGTIEDCADSGMPSRAIVPVSVSLQKINSVLGIALTEEEVCDIWNRFGYACSTENGLFTVTPPFERTDIEIPEDLIEEIGRIHGYADVPSLTPKPIALTELNVRFYYAEKVREILTQHGFSEIYTSSFRKHDSIRVANAFASDKGYLRSTLRENLEEALTRNIPNKDLLGLPFVALFEIGTVFTEASEEYHIALGVRHNLGYKEKTDGKIIEAALGALRELLGDFNAEVREGTAEFNFGAMIPSLPLPVAYESFVSPGKVTFVQFSQYPSISRDIALWADANTHADEIMEVLDAHAGALRVRTDLFDEFSKEGRTSYAFRLVFQSMDRTLTDDEVNAIMEKIYHAVRERGWEVR